MAKTVDINGFWEIKDNPLTKEGVFMYLGSQIDPGGKRWGLDQKAIYHVYRPVEEISKKETLESFEGVPFINEHDMLGDGCTPTDMKNIAGTIHNIRLDGNVMIGDFKIFSDEIKEAIRGGKKQLSLGYRANFEKRSGVFDGQPYSFVQLGIVGNHVALVDCGRCGSDVRIFDKSVVCDSISLEIHAMNKLEELKSVLDGMDEATLAKAEELLKTLTVKDESAEEKKADAEDEADKACADKKDDKDKADKGCADKGCAEDEADKKDAEDEAAKKAEEESKKAAEDAAAAQAVKDEAIRKETRDNLMEAIKLHDKLVPHIGEFCMDEMFTAEQVAKYGCEKLKLNVNAGSEIATLTGFLAGRGEANAKVVTTDEGIKTQKREFSFEKAYLAK